MDYPVESRKSAGGEAGGMPGDFDAFRWYFDGAPIEIGFFDASPRHGVPKWDSNIAA
ncbi:MAG: hypothetical protein NUV31_10400 [Dehalococcoidales bacterium]|jgi:hypothetical protein|nr:hypothetical protein [Dehalococcoidales bacterium]